MKNGRKKLTALILAGILAASMGTNAFAKGAWTIKPADLERDGEAFGEYLNETLPRQLSEENADIPKIIREYAKWDVPFSLEPFGLDGEYELSEAIQIHDWNDGGEDVEKYMVIVSEKNKMVCSLTAEVVDGSVISVCRTESIPVINEALASGAEIRLGYSHDCFLVYTQGKITVVENEYSVDESFIDQLALDLAQADKNGLNAEQRELIALAKKDHGEAVRYYHENMIYSGIYGTTILGEDSESELSLLSEKALIFFDKSAGKEAEEQFFYLHVYTDQGKRYIVEIPTKTRNLYTAAELLDSVPKEEKIVFAVFHYQSYEYVDEKVSIRISEYAEPWAEIGGSRYYIKSDGTVLTKAAVIDGIRYKFDQSGVCQGKFTGITKSGKGRRYWKDGTLVKNKWIRVKGERKYYAGADGYFVTGTRKISGKEYAFAENGALKK